MFLVVELLFIILLVLVLIMLYKNERISSRRASPQARAEEYWNGKERRKHTRLQKILDVSYTVRKKPFLKSSARTTDISEGGMKIVLDEKLPTGTILELKVPLPDSKGTQDIEAEVVWSEESPDKSSSGKRIFSSGVKFLAVRESSGSALLSYIRSLISSATGEN